MQTLTRSKQGAILLNGKELEETKLELLPISSEKTFFGQKGILTLEEAKAEINEKKFVKPFYKWTMVSVKYGICVLFTPASTFQEYQPEKGVPCLVSVELIVSDDWKATQWKIKKL